MRTRAWDSALWQRYWYPFLTRNWMGSICLALFPREPFWVEHDRGGRGIGQSVGIWVSREERVGWNTFKYHINQYKENTAPLFTRQLFSYVSLVLTRIKFHWWNFIDEISLMKIRGCTRMKFHWWNLHADEISLMKFHWWKKGTCNRMKFH